jgi:lysophospholipase L1-like esterase
LFSTATAFAEVRIVALGDSQMHGYHLPDGQSYPAQLEAASRGRQPQG